MKQITLGTTGITVPQNAFGALPIQRVSADEAVRLLRRAREGGMRFFDTARAYTDSEEKLGLAFGRQWDGLYVATKTAAGTPGGGLFIFFSAFTTQGRVLVPFHSRRE